MDLETQIRRLEQQLNAFEKLHANELKDFQEKLAAYVRIQADEVQLLRQQLDDLKKASGTPTALSSLPAKSGELPGAPPSHGEEADS